MRSEMLARQIMILKSYVGDTGRKSLALDVHEVGRRRRRRRAADAYDAHIGGMPGKEPSR